MANLLLPTKDAAINMRPAVITPQMQQAVPAPDATPAPTMPTMPLMGGAPMGPTLPAPSLPNVGISQRLTDLDTLHRDQAQGSGLSQIENPFLRGIARVGDVVASIVAPRIASYVPGTTMYHQQALQRDQANVTNSTANELGVAQLADTQAQADQRRSLATQEEAKAQALLHPKAVAQHYENLQQEHADAVMDAMKRGVDPSTDPTVKGVEDAITRVQPERAGKEPNKDDKFIAIQSKIASGTPLTPDEKAYLPAYHAYVQLNKIEPGMMRMQTLLQMPQAIADPNDPSRVIYATRRDAIGQEAPGSGDALSARKMDVYMSSGKGGQQLNAFNTAQTHMKILGTAADALNNGNVTALNAASQGYAKATGSAAPTNFNAVKNALKGEVSRALTGNVTVSEQAELDKDFNSSSSPQQIAGVLHKYDQLIQGKKDALRSQYAAGIKGNPDFDGNQGSGNGGGNASPVTEEYVYDQQTHKYVPKGKK